MASPPDSLPPVKALFLLPVFLLSALVARAESWPEFRGPGREGHTSAKLPLTWSPSNNVAWKIEVPGKGWSSPVVANGRIFLTSAVKEGSGYSLRALAFNAADGKPAWNTVVFSPSSMGAIHGKNSHASPTPLIEGDRIYVHFGHQGTAALTLDGKILWKTTEHSYKPVHGNGGSPVICGDNLIFSADGDSKPAIIALNKNTGKTVWKQERVADAKRKFSFATPLIITNAGRVELISPGSGMVGGLDPRTGKELWRVNYGEGYSVIPRPIVGHGMVFIGTGYDSPKVLGIRLGGTGDVTATHLAWTINRSAPHTPSMVLVGEELYFVSDAGVASCADAKTGKVHWQERVGGGYSSSMLHAGGRIYVQNEAGLTTVLAAGKEFKVLAKNDLEERTLASFAVADDSLLIRTEAHLYRITGTGK